MALTTSVPPPGEPAPAQEGQPGEEAERPGRHWRPDPWTVIHLLSLAAAAAVLVHVNREQWFFADDWEFVANRGPYDQRLGLFEPHNEHWSTLPILVYRVLLTHVGLRSYMPYVVVLIVCHLLVAHFVWRASLRAGASRPVATAVTAVFALLGAGAENLLWAFQIGFVGCVMLGWLAVLLHDHDGPFGRRDILGWLASIAALMTSGPAVIMIGVAALTVWLRRGRIRDALLTVSVPALAYGIWWVLAGREGDTGSTGTEEGGPWRLAQFVWRGLTGTAEAVTGAPGAVLVGLLVLWMCWRRNRARGPAASAFAGAAGAVAFFLMTGTGRVEFGLEIAETGRYVYIAAALLVPVVALAVTPTARAGVWPTLMVFCVCAGLVVHNLDLLEARMHWEADREQAYRSIILAAADLLRADEPVLSQTVEPLENSNLDADALRSANTHGWLPEGTPSKENELTAAAALQTGLEHPGGPLSPLVIEGASNVVVEEIAADGVRSCVSAVPTGPNPQVFLASGGTRWQVELRSDTGGTLALQLGDGGTYGNPVYRRLEPATPAALVSVADVPTTFVTLPEGAPTTICGAP